MIYSSVFVLFVLLCTSVFGTPEMDGSVYQLNKNNFDDFVNLHDLSLVEFYAPWCGHCKSLAPEYEEAAKILGTKIPLAKVDATEEGEVAQRFKVSGYPTLKVFRNGRASDYNGPRKAAGIVSYMNKQVGPAAKPINNNADFDELLKVDPEVGYTIVGFFTSGSSQLHSSFALISNRLRDEFVFGKVMNNPELAAEYGITGEGIVTILNGEKNAYTGNSKTSNVEEFIRTNSVPLLGEITEANQDVFKKRGLPVGRFLFDLKGLKSNTKQMNYFLNRFRKVASASLGQAVIAYGDKSSFQQQWEHYNFKNAAVGFVIEHEQSAYRYEQEFDANKIISFVKQALVEKTIKNYVKSEIEPKNNDQLPVKVVVGSTIQDYIDDDSKDILIEFYAPWCGHCKQLEPKFNELGNKFKSNPNVVIAKIDATANDYPRSVFSVSGYPSLFFRAAGRSNFEKYEGERDVEAMANYIQKNGRTFKKAKKAKKPKRKVIDEDDDDEL